MNLLYKIIPTLLLGSSVAQAFPKLENGGKLMPNSNESAPVIAIPDHIDSDKFYVPMDRSYIPNNNLETPQFSFTYDNNGGRMVVYVAAGFSEESYNLFKDLESDDDKDVRVLLPNRGKWVLSAERSDGMNVTLGSLGVNNESALPWIPMGLEANFDGKAVRYVARAFGSGGATVALNYFYTFKAVETNLEFIAEINWESLRSYMTSQNISTYSKCKNTDIGFRQSWFELGYSNKACAQSFKNIRKYVADLQENQSIKIISSSTDDGEKLRDKLVDLVISQTFKPSKIELDSLKAPTQAMSSCTPQAMGTINQVKADTKVLGISVSDCSAKVDIYVYDDQKVYEGKTVRYYIESNDIVDIKGHIPADLSGLCQSHPQLFQNVKFPLDDPRAPGCPTHIELGDDGSTVEIQNEFESSVPVTPSINHAGIPAIESQENNPLEGMEL